MNDADLILGKKKQVDMPAAKRMRFRCNARLMPLLDGLLEYKRMITGSDNFRPHNTGEWISGAKQTAACLDSYGVPEKDWTDWLAYALKKHNQNMLAAGKKPFVKSTRTLEYTVEGFVCHPDSDSEASRQRYAGAWEDDDDE